MEWGLGSGWGERRVVNGATTLPAAVTAALTGKSSTVTPEMATTPRRIHDHDASHM